MKKFKAGIIGCGNIFSMHAFSANHLECATVTAVCDIKEARAAEKAKEFGCAYYTDYTEMLDKEQLDVVHICTPHYLHAEMAVYAASKKVHILTEKPMSIKLADAENMIKAARENGVALGVIFQNRYNPGSVLIKKLLTDGELGAVRSGKLSVTWNRSDEYYSQSDWKGTWDKEGGGVIIDQAIHTLDLMNWFIGQEISSVDATIATRMHDRIEVEDSAEGVVLYRNGVTAGFYTHNYYTYDAPVEIELHCENGIAKMVSDVATVKLNNGLEYTAGSNPNEFFYYGDNAKSYWGVSHLKQISNFYESLLTGTDPEICGEEALKTQRIICAIYESAKTGRKMMF